jgi:uncharacterized protein (DUF488 family)
VPEETEPARRHTLVTFGHGRLEPDELGALLSGAGIEQVVDIRRFPGSRTNPAAARGRVPEILEARGIGYRWDERLGGRRSLPPEQDASSPDPWWQVKQFRAYAGWTRSPEFREGLEELVQEVAARRTAVMCSESVWWRCHRRLVADVVLVEHGMPVLHLMHDGRLREHQPSAGARVGDDGRLVWDRPA